MHVPIPENMELLEDHGDLVIRRTWRGAYLWPLLLFCIVWDGFMIFWYKMAFSDPSAPLMVKVFPIGHVAVGVGLTYFVIAGFLNKTDITISFFSVKVRSFPVKWFGDKEVAVDDIQQLYVTEKISQNKNGTQVRYTVNIMTKSNRQIKLVSGLQEREQAIFIEKKIEEILALPDEAVAGEV